MNTSSMHLNLLTLYFITVSLTGLVLLAVLVFISSPSNATIPWQKTFVYLIFILICFLGIMAGIFPSKCLKMIRSQKTVQSNGLNQEEIEEIGDKARTGNTGVKSREIEGHHPDCGNFSAHVFKLGDKTYCAGCTGLILGAMISIFSAVIYVLEGWFLGKNGIFIFWLGFMGVSVGLFYSSLFNIRWSFTRFFSNMFFVLGAFFILVGIETINGSLFIELYFLALVFILILTRILLSERKHEIICTSCSIEACSFY